MRRRLTEVTYGSEASRDGCPGEVARASTIAVRREFSFQGTAVGYDGMQEPIASIMVRSKKGGKRKFAVVANPQSGIDGSLHSHVAKRGLPAASP